MKEKLLGLEYTKLCPLHWHVKLITCCIAHSENYATLPEAIWEIIKTGNIEFVIFNALVVLLLLVDLAAWIYWLLTLFGIVERF